MRHPLGTSWLVRLGDRGLVDELFRSGRAAGWRRRSTPDARAKLIALGPTVVPYLIEHLERIDRSDLSYDGWDDEVWLLALAQIDDQGGKQYIIDCAAKLMDFPARESEEGDFTLGSHALEAMGASSDPTLHDLLVEWVLRIDTSYHGPDVWNLSWLVDPARPFLDEGRDRSS